VIARVRHLLRPLDGPPVHQVVRESGAYPLVILTMLNVVDELDRAVMSVMAPNIRRYFDIDNQALGAIVGLQVGLLVFLSVPVGYLGTRVDRARLLRWSAAAWGVFSAATTWALHLPAFIATRVGTGIGKAAVEPVGKSLLTDSYPPTAWNRVLAIHNAANPLGGIVGPLLAGAIAVALSNPDDAWRWGFLILTLPTFVTLVAARRMREPDQQMVKSMTAAVLTVTGAPHGMSFRQACVRLLRIPTFRRQIIGIGVLGFALVGVAAFGSVLFEEEFGVGEGGRGFILGVLAVASLIGTLVGGRVGERLFEESPADAVRLVGTGIAVSSVFLTAGVFLPTIWLCVPFLWVSILAVAVVSAPLYAGLSAITTPSMRPLMFSMLGLCVGLFGGVAGGILVGTVADAFGVRWGLASLLPFGVVGGLIMASSAGTVESDIAAVEREVRAGGLVPAAQVS
jgi:MFS family permease